MQKKEMVIGVCGSVGAATIINYIYLLRETWKYKYRRGTLLYESNNQFSAGDKDRSRCIHDL